MKRHSLKVLLATMLCLLASCFTAMAAETVDSGTCGDNLTWVLDDEGTLTISGTGEMDNFYQDVGPNSTSYDSRPWSEYLESIISVVIEDGVTSIGDLAFFSCTNLINVEMPDSVESIGVSSFCYCTSLKSIQLSNSLTNISYDAFSNCTSLSSIELPGGLTSTGEWAFYKCSDLESVKIASGVTTIGQGSFSGCTSLTNIEIPDSVTSIEESAFNNCSSLTSIEIPSSVASLGYSAFAFCSGLTTVKFLGDAPEIGEESAFFGVTATAYYPAGNSTWTEDVMQQYGGTITWVAYEVEDEDSGNTAANTSENDASNTGLENAVGMNIWMTLVIISACGFATVGFMRKKR